LRSTLLLSGNLARVSVVNSMLGAPTTSVRGDKTPNAVLYGTTGTVIRNTAISALHGPAIQLGVNARPWSSGTAYALGDYATSAGMVYESRVNNNIGNDPARAAGGWVERPNAQHPARGAMLENLAVSGVPDGRAGVELDNVEQATIRGGSITPAPGARTATGVRYGVATSRSTITGMNLSAMPNPVSLPCTPGSGNRAVMNTGTADHVCP
jgi:hypothetical protein